MSNNARVPFLFFLSEERIPMDEKDQRWSDFLPEDRRMTPGGRYDVAYGDYFSSARLYLEKDQCGVIRRVVSKKRGVQTTVSDIGEIRIFLKKHGGFYHPARIEADAHGRVWPFVLNVAFSDAGKACAKRERRVISEMNAGPFPGFLPEIHDLGGMEKNGPEGVSFLFFLGEWFDGYSELHLSRRPDDGALKLAVWDEDGAPFFLSDAQELAFYERAAFILACFYDLETFEQIFPWHHAAGDFVIKCDDLGVDVKLITARQRAALFGVEHPDADSMMEGAAFFLLNMSIRMRLDRIDGVGQTAWAGDLAVAGALSGFMNALAAKKPPPSISMSLDRCFREFILTRSFAEITDMTMSIVESFHLDAPDMPVIKKNIDAHIAALFELTRHLDRHGA